MSPGTRGGFALGWRGRLQPLVGVVAVADHVRKPRKEHSSDTLYIPAVGVRYKDADPTREAAASS